MLPFLRKMVKNMHHKDYVYLMIVNIVFNLTVLIIEGVILEDKQLSPYFSISLITQNNICFPLIGYYIENVMDKKYYTRKNQVFSIFISVVSLGITCLILSNTSRSGDLLIDITKYDKLIGMLICIPAASLYFNAKKVIKFDYNKKIVVIELLGSAVFGVYLIEKIMRRVTSFVFNYAQTYVGDFLASILWTFSAVALGFIIICSIRNVPYIGKYIQKWI